jgi:hypothetical protein
MILRHPPAIHQARYSRIPGFGHNAHLKLA